MNLLQKLLLFRRERRTRDEPVAQERRRKKITFKEAHERLESSLQDLEKTVSIKRDDFLKFSANDVQQTVQFETFRSICRYTLRAGQYRLCKNPYHEAANTGVAKCDAQTCPIMLGRMEAKSAA